MSELRPVTVITGASAGIGLALVRVFAHHGHELALVARREERLNALADEIGSTGARRPVVIAADLLKPGVAQLIRELLAAQGAEPQFVVNNAGFGLPGPFASSDPAELESLIRVNVTAVVLLTRALLPAMVEAGMGHVVNVASIAGHVGVQGEAVYAATKGALITFGESLRYELRASGVGVTTVSPGIIATRFFEREGLPYTRRFPRPLPPERVATAIVAAIRHGRAQVFVPRWLWFPVWLRGAAPWLYRRGASRWG